MICEHVAKTGFVSVTPVQKSYIKPLNISHYMFMKVTKEEVTSSVSKLFLHKDTYKE